MANFFTLISLENTKLWKRLSTKIMLLIMIVIVIAATSIYKYHKVSHNSSTTTKISENWKQDLLANLPVEKAALTQIEKTDKTSASIGNMKKSIAEDEYSIVNNIRPESKDSIWTRITKFDSYVPYSLIIALLLIIACSALFAGEFSEGTMKMMISRPYKRFEILTAKLIVTLFYGLVLLVTAFLLNFILLGIYFGFNGMGAKEMMWTSTKIIYIPAVLKTIIIYGLNFLTVLVYVLVAFALSIISRSRSIATGCSLFLLLAGSYMVQIFSSYFSWGKYLPFGLSDFTYFIVNGSFVVGTTLAFAIGVSVIYSVIFCAAGFLVFEKRDI
ncbi:ABC transporter permease [Clostridium sp. CF011]|uniref:ABC transporter permease n=1 Tax=unclassified Clostridium TaxID=2614128 RepID=UPI001C0C1953|nr:MULTISPECIES: ABC transporter permease subunit [unclassified Clostridium]MBU3093471.1 ABC transporter permease [Clostridium sp. CF011]MBW9146676.1 ABC transporter permease [Clostridium sp. CM027]UVE41660.1 ABC transporter permease [Clostridium sp. CM027]WAG70657.1 ABC transporter permease [Clostridium sp. CF011]